MNKESYTKYDENPTKWMDKNMENQSYSLELQIIINECFWREDVIHRK